VLSFDPNDHAPTSENMSRKDETDDRPLPPGLQGGKSNVKRKGNAIKNQKSAQDVAVIVNEPAHSPSEPPNPSSEVRDFWPTFVEKPVPIP